MICGRSVIHKAARRDITKLLLEMGLNTIPHSITNEKFEGTKCEIRNNK